jgi:hypothetical protein
MKTRFACLLVAFATLVLPDLAHACGNGAVQFADDFKTPDPGWRENSDDIKIGGGAITLLLAANAAATTYNSTYIFSDADVCVQIKLTDFTKPEQLGAGLKFWVRSKNDYYFFRISPNGDWRIQQRQPHAWASWRPEGYWSIHSLEWGNSDAIKKGVGAVNEVEVRLSGNTGTGYVNGTKVVTFNGWPPDGGGYFGVSADSENERANIWEFRDFKILKLQ